MKACPIVSARYWRVSVPFLEEWICSPEFGSHPNQDRLILELRDADGLSGWGEAPWRLAGGEVEDALKRLIGQPVGDLCQSFLDVLWQPGSIYWQGPSTGSRFSEPSVKLRHRLRHPLQVGVETALVDLLTRKAGVPFSSWFGGACRERVKVDYWMGRATPELAARGARRAKDLGFAGIKLKTILEDPNVERLAAIKEVAGEGFEVTLDPNGRFYRLDDAWPTLQALDALGNLRILEDAFPRVALAETAELRRRLNARVVVHIDPPESLATVISANCCGGLNLDSHTQGLFHWRMQAAVADQFNLPVWHGSGLDLGIYTAAQLHLAVSAPNCELAGDQAGPWLRAATLINEPFQIADGYVSVPQGAGLGVTPSLDQIELYATECGFVE